jgi:hypothetical protein
VSPGGVLKRAICDEHPHQRGCSCWACSARCRRLGGDLCEEYVHKNELPLEKGFRIFRVYHGQGGAKFYIITEADRSVTTVLLPQDY